MDDTNQCLYTYRTQQVGTNLGMASPGAQNPGFWEKSNLVMW